jgi:hypothetical protein
VRCGSVITTLGGGGLTTILGTGGWTFCSGCSGAAWMGCGAGSCGGTMMGYWGGSMGCWGCPTGCCCNTGYCWICAWGWGAATAKVAKSETW